MGLASVDHLDRDGITVLNDDVPPTSAAHVEPSADIRGMANFCRQLYVALLAQRFTPDQSLELVGRAVQGAMANVELTQ